MKQYYAIQIGKEFSSDYHIKLIFPTEELAQAWLTHRGYIYNLKNNYWEIPNDPHVDDGRWWRIQPVVLIEAESELDHSLNIIFTQERK